MSIPPEPESNFPDAIQEPRKVYVAKLIIKMFETAEIVYTARYKTNAISYMLMLIDVLDSQSKQALKSTYKELELCLSHTYPTHHLRVMYRQITDFLHKHYLREYNIGMINASSLPTTKEAPDKQAIPAKLSARLS